MIPDPNKDIRDRLTTAALAHVPFEGWSEPVFRASVADTGIAMAEARAACPRGAMDLAKHFHRMGDAAMVAALEVADLDTMRFRDRVAFAVRARLEAIADRECARRSAALFALPHNAPDGAALIWGTADAIWTALGDASRDINWYTKRATLSGVYASTVLFWLGDNSSGFAATWAFLDRRIENVMRFEKLKADVRGSRMLGPLAQAAGRALSGVRAPRADLSSRFPGSWGARR